MMLMHRQVCMVTFPASAVVSLWPVIDALNACAALSSVTGKLLRSTFLMKPTILQKVGPPRGLQNMELTQSLQYRAAMSA